ncbi:MAG: DUF5103 domain-containing protein [Chryseolinea sp.]
MKLNIVYLMAACVGVVACTPLSQSSVNSNGNPKILKMMDLAYELQIKTIELTPDGSPLQPAVDHLGNNNLVLKFDDLRGDRDNYYAKIIHCQHDWTASGLQDLEFLTTYNEFPFNNTEFSVDTQIPYVHYWITLPQVKIPGNYVVMVYRGSDKSDIVLSKRFMIFDNQVTFRNDANLLGAGQVSDMNQQMNFTVNYDNITILNPLVDVHVVIRQNGRWDNIATDVRPSFVRETEKEMEYRFFDETKMFRGGNEFRFFDLRSLNNPGRNVGSVIRTQKPFEVFIAKDKPRTDQSYSQYNDLDGGFRIDNYDYREPAFTNYAQINFTLQAPAVAGDVYVTGGFNYWNLGPENKMVYDSAKGLYGARLLLKQGWYDYEYLVKSKTLPTYYFEGSHFETENYYEIFFYNKPFQPRGDLLVGYLRLEKNPR